MYSALITELWDNSGLDEDPGWLAPPRDPLGMLRFLFISFCIAIVGIGVVAAIVLREEAESSVPEWQALAVVAALGCASLAAQALIPRPLDCTSARTLATSYRARFFIRMAMSEIVALVAFVLSISWGPWWAFYIGAAFTLIGFARLAPTRGHLQQDQDRLSLGGCSLSLTAVLRSPAA